MRRILVPAVVLIAASAIATPLQGSEIPAFARKYGLSCATCHNPIPRLTPLGEQFAANGFEFAVGEEPRDTINTGDPLLRLQNSLPLAIRYDAYMTAISKRQRGQVIADQQFPWVMKLLSGGQVANKISYYVYFLLTERGEVAGLEDAYVQFTDVGGSGVSAIVGQFQVSDPLFKRELRLEYEDYQAYRVRVGNSPVDLTYDRGIMALYSPWNGGDLALQVVSGQGLNLGNADRQYDRDGAKNVMLRASQEVGPLRVGAFGYYGSDKVGAVENRIRMFGPDATLSLGSRTELNVQLYRRWDSDPFLGSCSVATPCPGGNTAAFTTSVDAAMGELIFQPSGPAGRWTVSALANYVDASAPVVSLRLGEQNTPVGFLERYVTVGGGLHYLLRRNVRLLGETNWDFEAEQARIITGFVLGF